MIGCEREVIGPSHEVGFYYSKPRTERTYHITTHSRANVGGSLGKSHQVWNHYGYNRPQVVKSATLHIRRLKIRKLKYQYLILFSKCWTTVGDLRTQVDPQSKETASEQFIYLLCLLFSLGFIFYKLECILVLGVRHHCKLLLK